MRLIGVVGAPKSGKSLAVAILVQRHGFRHVPCGNGAWEQEVRRRLAQADTRPMVTTLENDCDVHTMFTLQGEVWLIRRPAVERTANALTKTMRFLGVMKPLAPQDVLWASSEDTATVRLNNFGDLDTFENAINEAALNWKRRHPPLATPAPKPPGSGWDHLAGFGSMPPPKSIDIPTPEVKGEVAAKLPADTVDMGVASEAFPQPMPEKPAPEKLGLITKLEVLVPPDFVPPLSAEPLLPVSLDRAPVTGDTPDIALPTDITHPPTWTAVPLPRGLGHFLPKQAAAGMREDQILSLAVTEEILLGTAAIERSLPLLGETPVETETLAAMICDTVAVEPYKEISDVIVTIPVTATLPRRRKPVISPPALPLVEGTPAKRRRKIGVPLPLPLPLPLPVPEPVAVAPKRSARKLATKPTVKPAGKPAAKVAGKPLPPAKKTKLRKRP